MMDEQQVELLILEVQSNDPTIAHSAACALRSVGPEAIPLLKAAFRRADAGSLREEFLRVIDHYRRPEDIPFFAEALNDPEEDVWQAANDALASQPSPECLDAAVQALQTEQSLPHPNKNRLLFLEDAVSELRKPEPWGVK